jgi:hypothetical protein
MGALTITAGCGGIADTDVLFNKDDGTSTFGAGGASSSSATGVTTTSGSPSTSVSSASSTTSSTSASSTSASTSTSATSTSASTTTSSSTSSSSTGGGGDTIPCGDNACPYGGESACCWDVFDVNDGPQLFCVDAPPQTDGCITQAGNNQGFQTRIECHTSAQCPQGEVCCGNRIFLGGNNAYYDEVVCRSSCDWPDVPICEANTPNYPCPVAQTNNGPVQTVCQESGLLPDGFWVCGNPPQNPNP